MNYLKFDLKFGLNFCLALGLYLISGLGITAGAHRLWAHRAYKAKLPLRILLTAFNTIAFQDCAIHWVNNLIKIEFKIYFLLLIFIYFF